MSRRRLAALLSLVFAAASLIVAIEMAIAQFPRGLAVVGCVVVALAAAWYGVLRRRALRVTGLAVAAAALALALILLLGRDPVGTIAVVLCAIASVAAARVAFTGSIRLPPAPAPSKPVMFFNPRSGGGKAERFDLAKEARSRGIEPIELTPGADLPSLVQAALADGADALAMAGGDGSQAVVAAAAAEVGVPYACIPAGTRNHFALDLGVDRDDVVGALDAFVDGGERRVDLAEVNGRVFVNNVSLGLYGDAVQQSGYRDAKLRTLLETLPDVAGPAGRPPALHWSGPDAPEDQGVAFMVSNNPYRLGRAIGSGTRPRLDTGLLGMAVIGAQRGLMRLWSGPSLQADSDAPVPAGIDGEAAVLDPPLRFATRPGALRVRIAPSHPGRSPSAEIPEHAWAMVKELAALAFTGSARASSGPRES
jgi:diacylglycerol kinase family enzyme